MRDGGRSPPYYYCAYPDVVGEGCSEFRLQAGKTNPTRVNAELRTDTAYTPATKLYRMGF
jgi:hypothetical protein